MKISAMHSGVSGS